MIRRIDYPMVLAEQFVAAVLGDLAEFFVDVCDYPALVRACDDGVFVQSEFQVLELLDGRLQRFGSTLFVLLSAGLISDQAETSSASVVRPPAFFSL